MNATNNHITCSKSTAIPLENKNDPKMPFSNMQMTLEHTKSVQSPTQAYIIVTHIFRRLLVEWMSTSGGVMRLHNRDTNVDFIREYSAATETRTSYFRIDHDPPIHCTEGIGCLTSMLNAVPDISTEVRSLYRKSIFNCDM